MGKCLECGKRFKPRAVDILCEKKFCSRKCQTRFHAKKRYYKLRNNPEYKKHQKEYFEIWRKKNREHFNDLCRERNRINSSKKFKERQRQGLCTFCGGERDEKKFKYCSKCRELRRKRYWRLKNARHL